MRIIILGLLATILISGCASQAPPSAEDLCIAACREAKSSGTDLGSGPCLSNEIADGWVCDVAHSPRQAVDNLPENQCPEYGKTASHFVEVGPECNVIRAA